MLSIRWIQVVSGVAAAAFLAAGVRAQTFGLTTLFAEDDSIGGLGNVSFASPTAVNNAGTYLSTFDLRNAIITPNVVTVRNGAVLLQGGQPLTAPPGAVFSRLGIFNTSINNNGDSAWFFNLDAVPAANDSGLFWNTDRVLLQKNLSVADAPGLTPGIVYIGFFGSRLNDNNQILFIGTVDDPAITSSVDRVVIRLDYNPVADTFTQTLVAKEGDVLPGQPGGVTVADFTTTANEYDFNNAGDFFYRPTFTAGGIAGIYKNSTPVALAGQPSPIAGRNYLSFTGARALNNTGGMVFRARLDGDTNSDDVIIKNGQVFMQEGSTVAGRTIVEFGTGAPVLIDDDGNVVWYGRWSTSGPRVGGLFWNDQLVLEDGVTVVQGGVIKNVRWISEAFSMSRNGRYIMARVILNSDTGEADAVIKIEVGSCPADFDGNGVVEPADIGAFINAWFASVTGGGLAGDFDNNGVVDPVDIATFIQAWFIGVTNGC
ncbi:MAG: hypothetical protein KF745_01050 [Phycisphaeraceae bacterium]|nr:hypothetical protein [Phycisphaeraceae bacterium]